jgi:hypothetical protein
MKRTAIATKEEDNVATAGCNVITFTTGLRFPFVPVINPAYS